MNSDPFSTNHCLARAKGTRFSFNTFLLGLVATVCVTPSLFNCRAADQTKVARIQTAKELFNGTNVWTVHFKFTPDQWEAMEPKGGGGGFFGGPRGPGGPGGFGGPRGGGPATVFPPSFFKS